MDQSDETTEGVEKHSVEQPYWNARVAQCNEEEQTPRAAFGQPDLPIKSS